MKLTKANTKKERSFFRSISVIHVTIAEGLPNNCQENLLFSVYIFSYIVLVVWNQGVIYSELLSLVFTTRESLEEISFTQQKNGFVILILPEDMLLPDNCLL